MNERRELELDGTTYVWDGRRWMAAHGRQAPTRAVAHRLNLELRRAVRAEDNGLADAGDLLHRALGARTGGDLGRAERLLQRALRLDPKNLMAGAVLSSVLREKGQPKAALAIANRFVETGDPPVLTSRAAALCDLKRWAEALDQIRTVLAMEKRTLGATSDEALAVYGRIRAGAAELFEGE